MMERQLGRESQKDNDLFYTCSLIDYIARKTKNKRVAVVDALGKERIAKIYDLADIYQPLWIEGTLRVEGSSNQLADSAYTITAQRVEAITD